MCVQGCLDTENTLAYLPQVIKVIKKINLTPIGNVENFFSFVIDERKGKTGAFVLENRSS